MNELLGQGVKIVSTDLSGNEPVACREEDGLTICYYDVDGDGFLDFSWAEGSQWDVLADDETLRQVSCDLLQRLTGRAYVVAEDWGEALAAAGGGDTTAE